MTGIMVCEYFILRHRKIKLSDLYHPSPDGLYHYWHGINWRSFTSWVVSWSYLIPGFAHAVTPNVNVPAVCTNLYYLAFPLGSVVSFLVHWGVNTLFPPAGLGVKDDVDYYGTFTAEEAMRLGMAPGDVIDGEDAMAGAAEDTAKGIGEPRVKKL